MMACGSNRFPNEHGEGAIKLFPFADSQVVQAMLLRGADVNATGFGGWTALHDAVNYQENKFIIKQLLDYGADPTLETNDGQTPIAIATHVERPDLITFIRQYSKPPDR